MCGRFVRVRTINEIADIFNIREIESDLTPSYNIAPKQPIVVVNEFMKKLHHRMPVILEPEYYDYWLNPENKDVVKLKEILNKFISQQLDFREVSPAVNSPMCNSPDCIEPLK